MQNELERVRAVATRLERAGFACLLTGSMAMNCYAQPQMTRDIDVVSALTPTDPDAMVRLDVEHWSHALGLIALCKECIRMNYEFANLSLANSQAQDNPQGPVAGNRVAEFFGNAYRWAVQTACMKTATAYRHHPGRAHRIWAVLAATLGVALANSAAAGSPDSAEIKISCQVTWDSNTAWKREFKDSENKPYQMGVVASETVNLLNDARFQQNHGAWEEIEGQPAIIVNGMGTYTASGKNAINKTVNSFAKEPPPTQAMVHIRALDFEEGYAILTVAKPETA